MNEWISVKDRLPTEEECITIQKYCEIYYKEHTINEGDYIVYCHINKLNGKKYVGITRQNPVKRWRNGNGYVHSPKFYNAIQKYGWDNFEHIILFKDISIDDANKIEQTLIQFFNLQDNNFGYNIADGGDAHNHNKYLSDESRHNMSISQRERFKDPKNHPWLGNEHTKQSKYKMMLNSPLKKQVRCIETDTVYTSINEAVRHLGLKSKNSIITALNKGSRCKGCHWEIVESPIRDSNRIELFCNKLAEVWNKRNDWRFGQLIENLKQYVGVSDLFYIEDDELKSKIIEFFNLNED